ncbi:phytanoyl-CoA dioxygenase family protein [Hydrogenophaga palleronii]|uniref:phytanoyl-CoA dioxygenase family protein n=1 Tax=Hydrogenophaga palleronii TaxID=65655 RepID=UPI000827049E|nr:phytanoyl-CoA dioxygenase family protein [Hydrogenophaga palleronii]
MHTGTLNEPHLLQHYAREGYAFPIRVMDAERALYYRRQLEASQQALGGKFEGKFTLKPHLLFPWLTQLATEPRVLDLAARVIGEDMLLWSTEFFIKQPGDQRFVSWHVDDTYWNIAPVEQVTVWIALSDIGPENGPLRYIPGSHVEVRLPVATDESEGNMLISGQAAQGVDESRAVDVLLRAGEVALHDGRTLHASSKNTGTDARIGIAARFIPVHVRCTATRESALLVRGTDRFNHFDHEPCPVAELDAAAKAAHARAVDLRMKAMYSSQMEKKKAKLAAAAA